MTGEQIIALVQKQRTAAGLRLDWFLTGAKENGGQRIYTAFAKDDAQKQAWLGSATDRVLLERPRFELMTAAELNDWYLNEVGYRPQEDDPKMLDSELLDLVTDYWKVATLQGFGIDA